MELLKYKCVQKKNFKKKFYFLERLERVAGYGKEKTMLVLTMTSQVSKGFR